MKNNDASSLLPKQPELFTPDGHLTDQAFSLLLSEQLDQLQVWRYPSIFPFVTSAWTVTLLCFAERFLWTATRASNRHRKNPPFPSRQPTI